MCIKNLILCGHTLSWCSAFIVSSRSAQPCHSPGPICYISTHVMCSIISRSTIACRICYSCSYYTFALNLGVDVYIANCCTNHFMLADLSLAARTIDNIHSSYNLSVSCCNCSKNVCYLVQPWDAAHQFQRSIALTRVLTPNYVNVTRVTHN